MKDFFKLFSGLLVVILVIGVVAYYFESFITEEKIEITVTNVNELTAPDGSKYYLVHTKDEIFENRNYQRHNKDNAAMVAKELKAGGKYKVTVVGFDFGIHLPLFLEHRNIIDVVDKVEVKNAVKRRRL